MSMTTVNGQPVGNANPAGGNPTNPGQNPGQNPGVQPGQNPAKPQQNSTAGPPQTYVPTGQPQGGEHPDQGGFGVQQFGQPGQPAPVPGQAPGQPGQPAPFGDDPHLGEPNKADPQPGDLNAVVAVDHSDSRVSAVQSLLAEAKVTEAEAAAIFGRFADTANPSDINMQALEKRIGKTQANLVVAGLKLYVYEETQRVQAVTKTLHDTFGGEQGWKQVQAWLADKQARDPQFAEQLKQLRPMLEAGGEQAAYVADRIKRAYENDPRTNVGNVMQPDAPAGSTPGFKPIETQREYAELLMKANMKGDYREMERIQQRWAMSAPYRRK